MTDFIPGEENLLSDVVGDSPNIEPIFDGGTLLVDEARNEY